jgi:hypothetical protein
MTRPRRDGLPGNGVRATLAGPDPNWSEFFPAERASALKLLFTRLGIGVDTVEIRRRVDHSGRGMAGEDNLAWLRGPASVPTKRQQPSDHVDPPSSRGRPSRCGSGAPVSEMRRGAILQDLARIQSHDVVLPASTMGDMGLRCTAQPDHAQQAPPDRLGVVTPSDRAPTTIPTHGVPFPLARTNVPS